MNTLNHNTAVNHPLDQMKHDDDDDEEEEEQLVAVTTPGLLLFLFLEPKSLTREKRFSRLGFSQVPVLRVGLQRAAFALSFSFSFSLSRSLSLSLACLFCRMRELAIAAAVASLAICGFGGVPD
ncbi:uncharacterized [Tachysurus ichikawai]